MKKYFNMAMFYLIVGLSLGIFHREFTKLNDFDGVTMLKGLHTHVLILGFIFLLVVLMIDKVFDLSQLKGIKAWFITYNVSLIYVIATMLARGIMQVQGTDFAGLSHIAGLGHALLGGSLIWFMILFGKKFKK